MGVHFQGYNGVPIHSFVNYNNKARYLGNINYGGGIEMLVGNIYLATEVGFNHLISQNYAIDEGQRLNIMQSYHFLQLKMMMDYYFSKIRFPIKLYGLLGVNTGLFFFKE